MKINNREQQKKFSERTNISNSTFDAMNTNQTRFSNGQGKNILPTEREPSAASYYFSTGFIYFTGVLIAVALFIFVVPLMKYVVSTTFYEGAGFLLCGLLFCVVMGYLWIYIGLKFIEKSRR
ncbi:hypothetical protein A5821_000334 [Enterococcus sp. 7F3_DIV0205]|uniref:Uncharacterized protein n=1 Tax=Candidatus Enterococcus palustris TaxID=1834189 RepID=A0AAQ3W9K8_9ENTE|nr:hypothetical protein [Enterococcus sp. 7F3_DIV0205]OTN84747.1 hypothetical protein A5821_000676 [Enterococcus sp. 7F3_DIV0205]